jgi:PPOX class probable F420-dependent enzyme
MEHMAELNEKARSLLDAPNLAFLATVMDDGSPHVSPVWIAREGDLVTFNTAVGRLKERDIRRDPRVAISLAAEGDFYRKVDIRGRVVELIEGEVAERQIDELAKKYRGLDEYPNRREGEVRVKVLVEPVAVR